MKYLLVALSVAFALATLQFGSAVMSGAEAHASKRKHTHRKAKRRHHRVDPKRFDPRRRFDPTGTYDSY
ncbi:MAG: hypothetical protein ACR2PA_05575, partial [Hyphomicrobiaceae bacterium]